MFIPSANSIRVAPIHKTYLRLPKTPSAKISKITCMWGTTHIQYHLSIGTKLREDEDDKHAPLIYQKMTNIEFQQAMD